MMMCTVRMCKHNDKNTSDCDCNSQVRITPSGYRDNPNRPLLVCSKFEQVEDAQ